MERNRCLPINTASPILDGHCVVYVMSRDMRVQDNHALAYAQDSAISSEIPLVVVFNLLPQAGVRSREHYDFMLSGLAEVESELHELDISFMLVSEQGPEALESLLSGLQPKELFFDFNPLRGPRRQQKSIAGATDYRCTVVDTHNIIPLWVLSDKEEYAAHTIRRKVHKNLEEWLVEPPRIVKHAYRGGYSQRSLTVQQAESIVTAPATGIKTPFSPGPAAARAHLDAFMKNRLQGYGSERNNPTTDGQSDLSPYLHYGHISSLRVALELTSLSPERPLLLREGKLASFEGEPSLSDSINALLEEMIVRKELADNYCFYNADYDKLSGAKEWALKSLDDHADDVRDFVYTLDQWNSAQTHDTAWNAAQREMMQTGKMHGYMRMYWAKKILEYSSSPAEAVQVAIHLNDRYSIDGGDPNGYTGIMWSIAGVHDRPWFDRSVYGKIRYMNSAGLQRKFDLKAYIDRWTA